MIKLIIDNSLSKIEGISQAQFKELRELLSYNLAPQASYFAGGHRSNKRYLLSARGEFPTGLLYIVEKYLYTKVHEVLDHRHAPITLLEPDTEVLRPDAGLSLYPWQVEAVRAAIGAKRGIISATTGTGKSRVIGAIIAALKLPALVVVPRLDIKYQLQADLNAWFNGTLDIRVENVDALDPNEVETASVLLIDEFHHSAAKTYRKLNQKSWKNIYYRFGMTATPFRSDDNERLLLESVLSQVIYRLDYQTAVDAGYIVPVYAYYFDVPPKRMKGNPKSWPAVYSELVVNNEARNELIADLLAHLEHAPTLCLVKEISHGEKLSKMTGVAFANGQADNTRELILEFNLQERKHLIGTTGVIGEGIDTRPTSWVIMAAGGKSKNQFMQQIGRGVRKYPGKEHCYVILFRDTSSKYLLKHFNAQVKYLKEEYNVIPIKLAIP